MDELILKFIQKCKTILKKDDKVERLILRDMKIDFNPKLINMVHYLCKARQIDQ